MIHIIFYLSLLFHLYYQSTIIVVAQQVVVVNLTEEGHNDENPLLLVSSNKNNDISSFDMNDDNNNNNNNMNKCNENQSKKEYNNNNNNMKETTNEITTLKKISLSHNNNNNNKWTNKKSSRMMIRMIDILNVYKKNNQKDNDNDIDKIKAANQLMNNKKKNNNIRSHISINNQNQLDNNNDIDMSTYDNADDNNNNVDKSNHKNDDDDVQELYITQKLDHYNAANSMYTFQQRYFYSNRYVSSSSVTKETNGSRRTSATSSSHDNVNNNTHLVYAFICIGGEGPYLDKSVLIGNNSPHCTGDMLYSAQKIMEQSISYIDIHLYAFEHRYYGESYPQIFPTTTINTNNNTNTTSPVTNEHLIYLSSRQSLADLAYFITYMKSKRYYNKVIVFGASYPGVLAAWSRYHYPHLIDGAISNSAPIQSIFDMSVYNNHVGSILKDTTIGGSVLCHHIISIGHEQLGYTIQNNNNTELMELSTRLNLCNTSSLVDDYRNVNLLIGDGLFYMGTQENDPSCEENLCNIQKKCQRLIDIYYNISTLTKITTTADNNASPHVKSINNDNHYLEMETLILMTNEINNNNNNNEYNDINNDNHCIDVNWDETIQYISDPILGMDGGLRSWLWQTCTEFGFYQTCERNSTCPYAQGYHLLQQDIEICIKAFNISSGIAISNMIQDTNIWSGGWKLRTSGITNILSITGTIDPWSELALEKMNDNNSTTNSSTMPIYHVKGASHHFWTHPIQSTDGPDIDNARQYIYQTIRQFLQLDSAISNMVQQQTTTN